MRSWWQSLALVEQIAVVTFATVLGLMLVATGVWSVAGIVQHWDWDAIEHVVDPGVFLGWIVAYAWGRHDGRGDQLPPLDRRLR